MRYIRVLLVLLLAMVWLGPAPAVVALSPTGHGAAPTTPAPRGRDPLPAFANPGPEIAFVSDRDNGRPLLYVADLDGRNMRRLTDRASGFEGSPDWSPSGDLIVFSAYSADLSSSTINIINSGGGNELEIVRSERAHNNRPRFSPDGSRIVFESDRDGNFHVYVARVDGSDQRRVTGEDMEETRPSWSPDGQRILFSGRANGVYQLFEVNLDGTGLRQLTDTPLHKRSAEYSPDGHRILFHATSGRVNVGPTQIYVLDTGTGAVTALTHVDGQAGNARWTRDGRRIVFTLRDQNRKGDVCIMNSDGSGLQHLTDDPANDDDAAVSAPLNESIDISNSPDTKNIVPPPPGDGGF
jgi:Tol biopolymer transport system component